MLDVSSTDRGFLPPRLALVATNSPNPVHNPAVGLLVYNTASAGADSVRVTPGYYFWDGGKWFAISQKASTKGEMLYWTGETWKAIPVGANGSVLTLCNGVPKWGGCEDSVSITSSPTSGQSIYVSFNDADPGWANGNVYSNTFVNQELATAATPANPSGNALSRSLISFDLSAIPANAVIVSAKLSLYGLPSTNTIVQGNQGANNLLVQRVLDNWNQTTVTWNTQPATTTSGQIELPPTTSAYNYDVTDIDVTQLVKDMRTLTPDKTAGFCLRLKTEANWRSVIFASTRHNNASKRPKLKIIYR
jgi:hypothetical protein